jgi:hypothetical protein
MLTNKLRRSCGEYREGHGDEENVIKDVQRVDRLVRLVLRRT